MILFLGMPWLVAMARAVIASTCDVSLHTESQSTFKVSGRRWAMLWEMSAVKACVRCVGVLALALGLMLGFMPHEAAGMYRNWRKHHTTANLSSVPFPFPLLLSLTSLPIVLLYLFTSFSPPYVQWLCSLFQPPAGRSFGQKQKTDVSLHMVVD